MYSTGRKNRPRGKVSIWYTDKEIQEIQEKAKNNEQDNKKEGNENRAIFVTTVIIWYLDILWMFSMSR